MSSRSERPPLLKDCEDIRSLVDCWNDEFSDDKRTRLGVVVKVRIRQFDERRGSYVHMGLLPADDANETIVQIRWGAGRYKAELLNADDKQCTSMVFEVSDPDPETLARYGDAERRVPSMRWDMPNGKEAPAAPARQYAPAGDGAELRALEREVEYLRRDLEHSRDALNRALERGGSGSMDMGAILDAVDKMADRIARRSAPAEDKTEALLRAVELGQKIAGGASKEVGAQWLDIIRDVYKDTAPLLKQIAERAAGGASTPAPVGGREIAAGEDPEPMDVVPVIDPGQLGQLPEFSQTAMFLIENLGSRGRDPDRIANAMLLQMEDDPHLGALGRAITDLPFADVVALHPQFETIRVPLKQLYVRLRDELQGDRDPDRGRGHDSHVASHGRADAGSAAGPDHARDRG